MKVELSPAHIQSGTEIVDIASCSCPYSCSHDEVYAVDTEGKVHLSIDGQEFLTKKWLNREVPPKGLFSTRQGVVILWPDTTFALALSSPISNTHLLGWTLNVIKRLQKDDPKLEIVDMEMSSLSALVLLSDGTIVISESDDYHPLKSQKIPFDPNVDKGYTGILKTGILHQEIKDDPKGCTVTLMLMSHAVTFAIIPNGSNRFAVLDICNKKLNYITTDVKVGNVRTEIDPHFYGSSGYTTITSRSGAVYQGEKLVNFKLKDGAIKMKTRIVEGSLVPEKAWMKGKTRVEYLKSGRIQLCPTRFGGELPDDYEEMPSPVSIFLPSSVKKVALTKKYRCDTYMSILTEEGQLFAAHLPW